MFGVLLALSLGGLALGPALVALGRKQALLFAALEGMTLALVPALVLLRLLPHLYEEAGPSVLFLMVLGYASFWLVERRSHRAGAQLGRTVLVPAMAVHSLLDGGSLALAFAAGDGPGPALLGTALVIHRFPEGLLLATTLTPQVGFRRMLLLVAVVAAATVVGALGGHALLDAAPHAALHGFVAFGLGVMLRLVVDRHAPPSPRPLTRLLSGGGFLTGLAILPLLGMAELQGLAAQPHSALEWCAALLLGALLALRVLYAGPWVWLVGAERGSGSGSRAHDPAPR